MPNKLYGKMFVARLGRIYSNISITAAVVCALSLIGGILTALFTVVWILFALVATLVTLGIILAYYPNLFRVVSTDKISNIIDFLFNKVAPPAAAVAATAGALSLVFLLLGEPKKDMGRIVFSAIVTVLGAVAMIAIFSAVKQ